MENNSIEVANYQTLIYNAVNRKIDPYKLELQLKKINHDSALAFDPLTDTELTKDDLIQLIMVHQFIASSVGLGDEVCTDWSAEELYNSFDYKSLRDMQIVYSYKIGTHMAITSALLEGIEQVVAGPVDENALASYISRRSKEIDMMIQE